MNYLEWSREIINKIMTKYKNHKLLYYIQLVLEPNPLNYDGEDSVIIEIWQKENNLRSNRQSVWFSTNTHDSIEEAIQEINVEIEKRLK